MGSGYNDLAKPRSPFAPGHRIVMNIVPLFFNLFVPWGVFMVVTGMTSGSWMFYRPRLVQAVFFALFLCWTASVSIAIKARRESPEPTWFTYFALALGLALFGGGHVGSSIYTQSGQEALFALKSLKVAGALKGPYIDVTQANGQNMLDVGLAYFDPSNRMDGHKAWHFKQRTIYCVAPIVGNVSASQQPYDFWVVGKDCCSESSSDFRCGDWGSPHAGAGLRMLDETELPFYRLAVQQAETLHSIVAPMPIFFRWSKDPLAEMAGWEATAFKNYLFACAFSFLVFLAALMFTLCGFAWIGRCVPMYASDLIRPRPTIPNLMGPGYGARYV